MGILCKFTCDQILCTKPKDFNKYLPYIVDGAAVLALKLRYKLNTQFVERSLRLRKSSVAQFQNRLINA